MYCAIACTRSFNFLRFTWYAFLQTFLLAKDKREIAFHQIITQQVLKPLQHHTASSTLQKFGNRFIIICLIKNNPLQNSSKFAIVIIAIIKGEKLQEMKKRGKNYAYTFHKYDKFWKHFASYVISSSIIFSFI